MHGGHARVLIPQSTLTYEDDQVYAETKMKPKEPEVLRDHLGSVKQRIVNLDRERGGNLRKKHLPSRLHDLLDDGALEDVTRREDVGLECKIFQN